MEDFYNMLTNELVYRYGYNVADNPLAPPDPDADEEEWQHTKELEFTFPKSLYMVGLSPESNISEEEAVTCSKKWRALRKVCEMYSSLFLCLLIHVRRKC